MKWFPLELLEGRKKQVDWAEAFTYTLGLISN